MSGRQTVQAPCRVRKDRRSCRISLQFRRASASCCPPGSASRCRIWICSQPIDDCRIVLSGRARLGSRVETRRGLDRTMAENLSDDLVLARPLVEEDLRAGVAEEVGIDSEAGESKACGFDLRTESLRRFRSARFS